jgi:hypothetical protein
MRPHLRKRLTSGNDLVHGVTPPTSVRNRGPGRADASRIGEGSIGEGSEEHA